MANSENTEEQEIFCELENPDREALNILMLVNIYLSRTVNIKKNHGNSRTINRVECCGNA
jgi:hypothetical protein